jgi:murein DD-endopeptidase MepM/ murein hydrolase activator NlpD
MIIIGLLLLSTLSMIAPQVKALPGVPPEVVCVPFHGQLAAVPHDTWIGRVTILKGTAHDKDGDGTMTTYKWDFGDGYSTDWMSGVNPYVIEAKHTYTGTMADGTPYASGKYFTAWLYVKDNDGLEGKDSYFIAIRDKTLDVEVNVALDNGLWWLHKQQTRGTYGDGTEYGYWYSSYGYHVSFTAASTEAFELQGHLPSGDRTEDPYVETVQRGLNYLFNQFYTYSISLDATYCPLGNPDVNSNGKGLACFSGDINRQIYETGMALMTISSSRAPSRIAVTGTSDVIGRAYKDIVQDMVDFLAWGQSDPYTGVYEGGWRYYANYGYSDNSVSQWPVIGMEAAEGNFGTSGVTVPAFVRPELLKWLAYSQGGDGGFGYTDPGSWENTAKTGAGCAMLSWAGVPTTDTKFQSALSFLNTHWYDTASTYTNFGDYYSMYGIMKGMRIPDPNIQLIGTHDWYAEYARYIVDQQNGYGGEYVVDYSWLSSNVEQILATAWAMAVLIPTLVKPGPVAEAGPNVDNFPPTIPIKLDASGSYHRDPTKSIVLYEWDFESDGVWDYSFGRFVYPTGLLPTAPDGKRLYGYDGACTCYEYAGWLARGDKGHYLSDKYHLGQDIEANVGDDVYAITDGVVAYISYNDWGAGNLGIVLRHALSDGTEFLALYGHVRSDVEIGDHVADGESFATIGPYDSVPHLHFGIHPGLTMPLTNWGAMPLSSWPDPNAYPGDPNGPNTNGFVDPMEWITTRTPLKAVPLYVEHAYPAYYNPDGSIDWDKTAKDYTAALRVTDNNDPALQDTDTCIVHITSPPWKPVADPGGPYEGYVGVSIQLDGSKSYDPESKMYSPGHPWYETIAKYEWDLDNDGLFDDSLNVKPSYAWDTKGTYSVGLRVTDSLPSGPGGTTGPLDVDTRYTTVVVKETPPRLVTLTIVEVRALDPMDPIGPLSSADFYAKVSIDGASPDQSAVRSNDDDIYPRWTFSRLISKDEISIHIEIWDSDWPLGDDHVDINKNSGHNDLDLTFDLGTQSVGGDVTYEYSKGGGGDGNRAEIWFNVGLGNGDKDGDGLFDSWETAGIHMNDDGVVDLNLPALGANPDRKDLFIEIDWMADGTHSHRPMAGVSQTVINAFADAPVTNPDGTSGINLHIDESNGVPHQNELAVWAGFDTIKATNFDQNRRFAYHYCLSIHNIQGLDGTSGIAELPGNDFIVSLGSWTGGVGTFQQQAGTLMHEFGHNLNLGHGGGDHVNYKPNYLSIMNYFFQMSGILPTGRLDYSGSALPNLDENGLNENLGIQDGTDNTNYYSPTGAILVGPGTGSIDWDADGIIEIDVQADINRDGTYLGPIQIPSRTVLTGYNDWANILYSALGTSDFEDGVHLTSETLIELDVPTYNKMTSARDYLGHAIEEINFLRNYATQLYNNTKIGRKEYNNFMRDLDKVEKDIDKAIKNLDKERHGYDDKMKGFEDLRHAVMKLKHIIKDVQDWAKKGKIPAANATWIISELEAIRMKLVDKARAEALAERALALKAIEDAKAKGKDTTKAEKEIAKVDCELAKAEQKIAEGKLSRAIQHFKHAFAHSQHAIKKAYDPKWTIDYKDWIDELEEMDP